MSLTKVTYSMIAGGAVNVLDYGASATATASANTAAIQAAISAASGRTVYISEQLNCNPITVTGATVDIEFSDSGKLIFAASNNDDFVLDACTGRIRNYRATHTGDLGGGVFSGLKIDACNNLLVDGFTVDGGKDILIFMYDSDNIKVANGNFPCDVLSRAGNAGYVFGCRDSGFSNCSAENVEFGFAIVGAGYKSGTIPPPRTYDQEMGMYIRDCYVYDHTSHAFDINGAVGATISRCVADTYTGNSGNASFQIKNSTNLPSESEIDTRSSTVEHSVCHNGEIGFFAQDTRGAYFINNRVIRCQSYGVYLNDADFSIVSGISIEDWCLDATATGANGETKVSAIGVADTSSDCKISGVSIRLKDTPNASNMRLIYAGGARTEIFDMKVQKITGASDVSEGLVIAGANCYIAAKVVPSFSTTKLNDIALTTAYEMSYGITWSFSSGTSATFNLSPTRGMIVGSVSAYLADGVVSGHVWTVGRVGDNDAFVTSRTAATETIAPNGVTNELGSGQILQAFGSSGSGSISLNVIVSGVAAS